jgi:hypothetical protein
VEKDVATGIGGEMLQSTCTVSGDAVVRVKVDGSIGDLFFFGDVCDG